jgi:hypothetical protein
MNYELDDLEAAARDAGAFSGWWTVWLDDLNPHIDAACRVAQGKAQEHRRGCSPFWVVADGPDEALDRARQIRAENDAAYRRAR